MTEYTGDEAIEQLTAKIRRIDGVSGEDIEVLLSFKRFLQNGGIEADEVIVVLYGWYELLPHCDFDLERPEDGDIAGMVEDAPAENRSMYRTALDLFYNRFLPERGVHIEEAVLDW